MLIIDDHGVEPDFRDTLYPHKLACAAEAMTAIAAGLEPTSNSLSAAPIVEEWWQGVTPWYGHYCLLGLVSGHPHFGTRQIHTSAIRAIALDRSWARTTSRWYRLGKPLLTDTAREAFVDGDRDGRLSWPSHDGRVRRVQAVARVLDELAANRIPAAGALVLAPTLHGWSWAPHPNHPETDVLWGFAVRHPEIGNQPVYTGRVWAMGVDRSWARTTERYYRLGTRFNQHARS